MCSIYTSPFPSPFPASGPFSKLATEFIKTWSIFHIHSERQGKKQKTTKKKHREKKTDCWKERLKNKELRPWKGQPLNPSQYLSFLVNMPSNHNFISVVSCFLTPSLLQEAGISLEPPSINFFSSAQLCSKAIMPNCAHLFFVFKISGSTA